MSAIGLWVSEYPMNGNGSSRSFQPVPSSLCPTGVFTQMPMDSFVQDVRFALRSLWKSRLTTVLAVLCLALGIGANTAIFSVVRAVLLESLPYRDADRLVMGYESVLTPGHKSTTGWVAPANFFEWQKETRVFTELAGFSPITRDLGDISDPERLRGVRSTTNLFQ